MRGGRDKSLRRGKKCVGISRENNKTIMIAIFDDDDKFFIHFFCSFTQSMPTHPQNGYRRHGSAKSAFLFVILSRNGFHGTNNNK